MDDATKIQWEAVLGIMNVFNVDAKIEVIVMEKIIADLVDALYVETIHDNVELGIEDALILPYSTQEYINYTELKASQICQKYRCKHVVIFLAAFLKLHKQDVLCRVRGVRISADCHPLVFLSNMEVREDNITLLNINIPADFNKKLSILRANYLHHWKLSGMRAKRKIVKVVTPPPTIKQTTDNKNYYVLIGGAVTICIAYLIWRKLRW